MPRLPKMPPFLRPAANPSEQIERQKLVERIIAMRREIQIDLDTEDYYNRTHPDQPPITAYDTDGEFRRWCDEVDAFLKSEAH